MNKVKKTKKWLSAFAIGILLSALAILFFLNLSSGNTATCRLPRQMKLKTDNIEIRVTSEEIEEEKKHELYAYAEEESVDQRGAKEGDIIYLRYTLYSDGEVLIDTEQSVESFELGEEYFPDELQKHLYGLKPGETFKVEEKLPDDFSDRSMRGKKIKFEGQIVKITELILPEITNEFVKDNLDYNSISEYNDYLYKKIYDLKLELAVEEEKEKLIHEAISEAEFDDESLKEETDKRYNEIIESYCNYAELFGYATEDVYDLFNTSTDELYETALYTQKKVIFCDAVIDKEKLMPSQTAYDNMRLDYAKEYGYNSAEEFADDNGDTFLNECVNEKIVKDYLYFLAIKD
ncbi:MAG: hypothetical protein K6G72_01120 [Lachnospiraceae bacterium]|nr:hypothetical protein [Lachnospiraceae bacterium]